MIQEKLKSKVKRNKDLFCISILSQKSYPFLIVEVLKKNKKRIVRKKTSNIAKIVKIVFSSIGVVEYSILLIEILISDSFVKSNLNFPLKLSFKGNWTFCTPFVKVNPIDFSSVKISSSFA